MDTVVVHESMQAITDLKLELAELKEKVKEQEAIIRAQERMVAGTASKSGFVWKAAGVKPITYIRGNDGNPRFEEGQRLLPEFLKIAKKDTRGFTCFYSETARLVWQLLGWQVCKTTKNQGFII